MKKLLLTLITLFGIVEGASAQCAITSTPFQNCSYYGDRITAFSLNSIPSVGNAGCAPSGYSLYATPIRTLQMGNTYSWTASTGVSYANGLGIWIDWNNNGQWAANEIVAFRNYAFNHSGTLTVPYNAAVGVNIRMRVMCSEYYTFVASTNPCSSLNGYGETEDYNLYIACPGALPTLTVANTSTYICLGQSATLTASGAQNYTWTGGAGTVTNGIAFSPTVSATYTVTGGISACPAVTNTAVRTISVTAVPLAVTASPSSTQVCAGVSTTITAGGASNYTWTPNNLTTSVIVVSPTTSITYSLVGYNGTGCPGAATVALAVSPMPTIVATASPSSACVGSTVALNATGALSYTWSPGGVGQSIVVSPTVATLYSVSGLNSAGCAGQSSAIVLVTGSPTINVTASSTNICVGGSVTLNASGGNIYSWTGGPNTSSYVVSPTTSTSYTVTGTNTTTGCSTKKVTNVNVFVPAVAVQSSTAICSGAAITLTASGANGYTWTPGGIIQNNPVSPLATTVYTLTTNSQTTGVTTCVTTRTLQVTVNPNPTVTASASPSIICKFASSNITANGASSYVWNTTATTAVISVTPGVSGTQVYSVTGTNSFGCQAGVQVLLGVNSCSGLQELSNQNPISIYPNPNKGDFTIKYAHDLELKLVNELGQLVQEVSLNGGNNHTVSISQLPAGIYFLVYQTDSGQAMQKIMVK
ncbi:MAG: GEVED domain-containing protein [bacterium]|nr:GEVED domain-containing protein [bacterium]